MPVYVQIIVNISQIKGVFDYHLPDELAGQVQPGCLVEVPFGRQLAQGIVLRFVDEPQVMETKPVQSLLDARPVLTAPQIELALWLAEETLSAPADCFDLFLPPGLSKHTDTLYTLVEGKNKPDLTGLQDRIYNLLVERGPLRGRQLDAALPRLEWEPSARALIKQGFVTSRSILPPPGVRPKVVRTAQLFLPLPEALAALDHLRASAARDRQRRVIEVLAAQSLPLNVSWIYAESGANLADLQRLADAGIITFGETEWIRDPLDKLDFSASTPPDLTPAQRDVLAQVVENLPGSNSGKAPLSMLLEGVTGSGKTEIYLRAVEETLKRGRQVLALVPEISLTPQTVQRFAGRFPGKVGLIHSRLSPGERYDTWRRARDGRLNVIVGPRSALFAPLPDIGLIILDECHDGSYYQDDVPPIYNTVAAAQEYGRICKAAVLFGSATPSVELSYQAERNGWPVLRLPDRVLAHRSAVEQQMARMQRPMPELPAEGGAASLPLPEISVVDMRQELKAGNRSIFSRALQEALTRTLDAGQQAILFLNRRGSATYVFCRSCGTVLNCPRCEKPLTFHTDPAGLFCHTCGYRRGMPSKCAVCGSDQIRQFGAGTETVEKALHEQFPSVRSLRFDYETTREKGAHELILSHFAHGQADVLVGTQMLAKGLDLPLVTLVGVMLADVGIALPDFRAGERTFQLLTQVAGRAGRSPLGGRVVMQSYQPEHYAIQFASKHDYEGFCRKELELRKRMGYPPYARLARLEIARPRAQDAEQQAAQMVQNLQEWMRQGDFRATEIIGPAPCFFARVGGLYRWQILLRGPDPARLLRGHLLGDWKVAIDPGDLL